MSKISKIKNKNLAQNPDSEIENTIKDLNKNLCRAQRYDAVISDIFADMPVPDQDKLGFTDDGLDRKKTKRSNRTDIERNTQIDQKIASVVGVDVAKNLKRTEERRLKVDIKQGTIHKSKVLIDMIKRCPHLEQTIQQIINCKKDNTLTKQKTTNIENNMEIADVIENTQKPEKESGHPKRRKPVTKRVTKKRKLNTKNTKKLQKKPKYDNRIKQWVEDLGSEDTDEEDRDIDDQGDDIDRYKEDGFVTYDRDDDSDQSSTADNESDISNETDDPVAELNDLYDDHITTRVNNDPNMTEDVLRDINKKIKEIRENQEESRIDIAKVMIANFNKEDSLWFYKNIKRVPLIDGQERFNLEDKIEKRYALLKSLQNANMYENFNVGTGTNDRDTTKDIMASNHPMHIKRMLLNKMYTVTNESMEEYQKTLNWMDTVLNIPTEVKSSKHDINSSMNRLYVKLQQNFYGMDNVIKQILQAVCTILTDPNNEGYILTLVGPPGVGKTTISTLIAEAIGMGFGQVSCGSIADQATIVGHGSTYIGSKPGVFTQCLINNGQMDNVILLDEMDKMYDSKILPILLHVLDRSQNNRFKDAFCPEVDIDLSKNLYIIAVNSLDSFDDALRDRLKVVHIDGYDIEQKIQICIKHIIPRLMKKTSVNTEIDNHTIKRCIQHVSPKISGVRDLERFFGDIYEKLLLVKHMGGAIFNFPAHFNPNDLKKIDEKIIYQLSGLNI